MGWGGKWEELTYFVESEHLTGHLSAVVKGDAHSVVDEVLHFALFVRHGGGGALESGSRMRLLGWMC